MVRLLVYFAETEKMPNPEREILQKQYQLMQRRLWYGITWPSAIITAIMGTLLVIEYGNVPTWLWVKLGFVLFLYGYHFSCHYVFSQQQKGIIQYTSNQLRIWNEVSTVFLVAIIFLVVLKNLTSMIWGLLGLIVFSAALMTAIMIYKKIRTNKSENITH
jgi:putative membrane protein